MLNTGFGGVIEACAGIRVHTGAYRCVNSISYIHCIALAVDPFVGRRRRAAQWGRGGGRGGNVVLDDFANITQMKTSETEKNSSSVLL